MSRRRLQLRGRGPNRGIIFVSLKPISERRGATHSAAGGGRPAARAARRHHGGHGHPVPAPGHPGRGCLRRLPVRGAGQRAVRSLEELDEVTRELAKQGNARSGPPRPLQRLHRERPPVRGDDRPREGEGAGGAASPDHRRPADLHGLGLRERLRLQQPFLPRLRAGRPAVPLEARGHAPVLRARRQRGHDARSTTWSRVSETTTRPDHQPLQPVPLGRDQRHRGARLQLRPGDRGHGGAARRRCCRWASASSGPGSRWRRSSRGGQSLILFGARHSSSST